MTIGKGKFPPRHKEIFSKESKQRPMEAGRPQGEKALRQTSDSQACAPGLHLTRSVPRRVRKSRKLARRGPQPTFPTLQKHCNLTVSLTRLWIRAKRWVRLREGKDDIARAVTRGKGVRSPVTPMWGQGHIHETPNTAKEKKKKNVLAECEGPGRSAQKAESCLKGKRQ